MTGPYPALIGLTFLIAGTAIAIVVLGPVLRDGRTPAPKRVPGDIPPGWTRNERGALVPPVPHSPQKKAPRHAAQKGGPRQPWKTAAQPALPPEPAPEQDRYPAEEFLDLPVVPGFMRQRGDWGVIPQEWNIAAEQLPKVIA